MSLKCGLSPHVGANRILRTNCSFSCQRENGEYCVKQTGERERDTIPLFPPNFDSSKYIAKCFPDFYFYIVCSPKKKVTRIKSHAGWDSLIAREGVKIPNWLAEKVFGIAGKEKLVVNWPISFFCCIIVPTYFRVREEKTIRHALHLRLLSWYATKEGTYSNTHCYYSSLYFPLRHLLETCFYFILAIEGGSENTMFQAHKARSMPCGATTLSFCLRARVFLSARSSYGEEEERIFFFLLWSEGGRGASSVVYVVAIGSGYFNVPQRPVVDNT